MRLRDGGEGLRDGEGERSIRCAERGTDGCGRLGRWW